MHFLSAALMAVALNMGFTSCGSDEIDEAIKGITVEEVDKAIEGMPTTILEAAEEFAHTGKLTIHEGPIKDLMLMVDGKLIGHLPLEEARATRAGGAEYVEGTYTVNSDGSITATLADYNITITPNKNEVIINDTPYAADVASATTSDASKTLCRSWYPTEYNTVVYAGTKAIGNYKSQSLVELQKMVSKDINTNVKLLAGEVNQIDFLKDGTIITNYKGNDYQVASWSWINEKKGELKASFSASDKDMIDVPGFTRFQKGTPNTCYLVSAFKVEATGKDHVPFQADLKVIITMKDAKAAK